MPSAPVFHVKVAPGQRHSEVVSELARALWLGLMGLPELRDMEPHRRPAFYLLFLDVVKTRLIRRPDCGDPLECRRRLKNVADGKSLPLDPQGGLLGVYTLAGRGGLDRFSKLLSGLAERRLRGRHPSGGALFRTRAGSSLRSVLDERMYHGDGCAECPLRREREGRPSR